MAESTETPDNSGSAELPGLDLAKLEPYLRGELPGLLDGTLSAKMVAGGRSNLTYLLDDGSRRLVLRRPPLGHVLATAHDMSREHKVISALAPTDVPVPATHLLCNDDSVIGAQFYLMDFVDGMAIRSREECAELTEAQRHEIGIKLIDVLADLHAVDDHKVGLGDFGKPEGFLERQVGRWGKQLESSRSRELPGIDELREWLAANLPQTQQSTIVHGDYRLDNVLVRTDPLRISAVLDWEMATRGDPLTDLGLLYVYWHGTGSGNDPDDPITEGVTALPGFPEWSELAEHYAARTGFDLGALDWYKAFGYFKLAVVLEGIYYRFSQGATVGEGFDKIGERVPTTIEKGLSVRGET
jgi:aminoglycoside phosphotransferase (APT) family kinase protein